LVGAHAGGDRQHTATRIHPLLGFKRPDRATAWFNHVDTAVFPWLADHAVEGTPVLPPPRSSSSLWRRRACARRTRAASRSAISRSAADRAGSPSRPSSCRPTWCARTALRGGEPAAPGEQECAVHAVARVGAAQPSDSTAASAPGAPVKIVEAAELYALAARLG